MANLSALPAHVIDWIDAGLKGARLVPAEAVATVTRSLPHGPVAAVLAQATRVGAARRCWARPAGPATWPWRWSCPGWSRPARSCPRWVRWADTTLGVDLDVAGASTDEVYAAMDWLLARQDRDRGAAGRPGIWRRRPTRPDGVVRPVLVLGGGQRAARWPRAATPATARSGKLQIEYGLLTDPAGRPVAVRVFPGNTADPAAFVDAVEVVRERFGLAELVMVGDRGMITSARIDALRELGGTGWLTALRAPQIAALAADHGPLQLSLFDQQDLAEISHPDYPGERLIACRNPLLADRTGPQTRRAARRHRGRAGPDHRRGRRRAADRRRPDRAAGRQGDQQVQDGQALRASPSPTPP